MKNYWLNNLSVEKRIKIVNQWFNETNPVMNTPDIKVGKHAGYNIFNEFYKVVSVIEKYLETREWEDLKNVGWGSNENPNILCIGNFSNRIELRLDREDTLHDWLCYVPIGRQLDEWYADIESLIVEQNLVQRKDYDNSLSEAEQAVYDFNVRKGRGVLNRCINIHLPYELGSHMKLWTETHYMMLWKVKRKSGFVSMQNWQNIVEGYNHA